MDIFDGARVVMRWWFVVVPIVVLTMVAALLVTSDIQPEYKAEGSVLIVGPAVRESSSEPGEFENLNPLLDQPSALETVAIVVSLSIEGPEVADLLAAEGLSTTFALGTERGAPIILIETSAESRDVALRTAERVADLIDEEVRLRQAAGDVAENERVTTSVVQLGVVGGADLGGRSRARILIGAVGMGLAVGAAFLLEGIRRRREEATMADPALSTDDRDGRFEDDVEADDDGWFDDQADARTDREAGLRFDDEVDDDFEDDFEDDDEKADDEVSDQADDDGRFEDDVEADDDGWFDDDDLDKVDVDDDVDRDLARRRRSRPIADSKARRALIAELDFEGMELLESEGSDRGSRALD